MTHHNAGVPRPSNLNPVPAMTEAEAKALLNEICGVMCLAPRYRTRDVIMRQLRVEVMAGDMLREI